MEPLPTSSPTGTAFVERLRASAGGADTVTFAQFMRVALYDPEVGYYRAARRRVGRKTGTDFYTASSMDAVFGALVAAAAANTVDGDPGEFAFVEVGAEPGESILNGLEHRFSKVITLRLGDSLEIPSRAVVFSNELFDAQPCHRVTWRRGGWREIGVAVGPEGELGLTEMTELSEIACAAIDRLPSNLPEGYTIDLPIEAENLNRRLAAQQWSGAFLALDYGRSWTYLCESAPEGTARAYHQHQQSNDLLANPGQQDLTCHICWDWHERALEDHGFSAIRRQSQEAFFVHEAGEAISRIVKANPNPLSKPRTQLKELLHPGLLGQRFEALVGVRGCVSP